MLASLDRLGVFSGPRNSAKQNMDAWLGDEDPRQEHEEWVQQREQDAQWPDWWW